MSDQGTGAGKYLAVGALLIGATLYFTSREKRTPIKVLTPSPVPPGPPVTPPPATSFVPVEVQENAAKNIQDVFRKTIRDRLQAVQGAFAPTIEAIFKEISGLPTAAERQQKLDWAAAEMRAYGVKPEIVDSYYRMYLPSPSSIPDPTSQEM